MKRVIEIIKIFRKMYLKRKIEKTETKLCKYVSLFMDRKVIAVAKYLSQEEIIKNL